MATIQDISAVSGGNGSAKNTKQTLSRINRDLLERATQSRAKELNREYIDVGTFPINPDILHVLPLEEARRGNLIPFFRSGKNLRVAVAEPENTITQEVLKQLEAKGFTIQLFLASEPSIQDAQKLYAGDQYKLKLPEPTVVKEEEIKYEKELVNLAALKDKLSGLSGEEDLHLLNVSAIRAGASDIHYQPEADICLIRLRIDGVLHNAFEVERGVYEKITNQLKYKSRMKLNVTSVPQDGRFHFIVNERKIDVRVASLPTEFGEAFVCRILDTGKHFSSFEDLGFSGKSLAALQKASSLTQGMVLVTGPTSSGKTTTLYVLLNQYNRPELKIITLEDPIEYHLKGITQSQMEEKRGYTFAEGLRSILRQDPDVVMIGEIRDKQTAEVCSQAALTGHVVLSTLHTNSAVETIPRLLTIGVPAFMIAPALSTVVAQRLVRRLCHACEKERSLTEEEKELFSKTIAEIIAVDSSMKIEIPKTVKTSEGCDQCNSTRYRGQMVISEVLFVDDELKEAILKNASTSELFTIARKKGMLRMAEDAILKVIAGHTTLEEVHRVINA